MDNLSRHSNGAQTLALKISKQRRSGYEPSDTETELQDTPWHDRRNSGSIDVTGNNTSLLKLRMSSFSKFEFCHESPATKKNDVTSTVRRRHNSKSPYKPKRDDSGNVSPISNRRNISPLPKSQRQKQTSPYEPRIPTGEGKGTQLQVREDTRVSKRSGSIRRSATAPRQRTQEREHALQEGERTLSPLSRSMNRKQREPTHKKVPSVGELNEMVAHAKITRAPTPKPLAFLDSTDSISPGDIFFSVTGLAAQKNVLPTNGTTENHTYVLPQNSSSENHKYPRPTMYFPAKNGSCQQSRNGLKNSTSSGTTRTSITSSSALSRQSSDNSKITDLSGRTTSSMRKFTDNRRKNQSEPWFACMRKGSCRTSKSPERVQFDEAAFIEKAYVVEHLRQFWADKHQPGSLNGFTCHKKEAELLKQLVSQNICPHILFRGPSGSGKKTLTMALLSEIYGDACWDVSYELRAFAVQDQKPMQVVVPVTSSAHHVELNVKLEANARYALMGIVKEISNYYAIAPEVSNVDFKPDYKVIVLYDVDKAPETIQHLIKWIMDCNNDACKLILCCNDDADIIESVKNHCKVINVDTPVTNEIMEVLVQIAKKEGFDLSMSFAAKLATKSKQNLRKAIMALEACKAHVYPFNDDQPIPIGWEEVLVELAEEILADPSPKRLFLLRGKLQKLLVDFVHPRLILLKLSEQFLKGVHASSRREVYYWHAYYDKRLPTGTAALLKLEEYVAKFMSIHRKSFVNRPHFV